MAVLRYRNLLMSGVATPLAFVAAPFLGVMVLSIYVYMSVLFFAVSSMEEMAKAFLDQTKRRIFLSMLEGMERFKRLLNVRLGHDVSLQSLRMLWAIVFIIGGAGVAAAPHLFPSNDAFFRKALFWNWYQGLAWTPGLAMMLLGVMVLDWLVIRALWQDLLPQLKRPGNLLQAGGVTLFGVPFLYGFFAGIDWLIGMLKRWGLERMLGVLSVLVIGTFTAAILWKAGRGIYSHIRDRRTFKRIAVTNRMPRQDITAALDSLLTNHWRLAFVRQLAQQKIMAIGNWPAGFRLSVAADPVLTELAKLEERWLKLDR